jgi:hypothetical protein
MFLDVLPSSEKNALGGVVKPFGENTAQARLCLRAWATLGGIVRSEAQDDYGVAWLQTTFRLPIARLGAASQGLAPPHKRLPVVRSEEHRLGTASRSVTQAVGAGIDESAEHRRRLVAGGACPEGQIDLGKQMVGVAVVLSVRAECRSEATGDEGGLNSLSRRIAQSEGNGPLRQGEPVVELPSDGSLLGGPAREVPPLNHWGDGRELVPLDPFCGVELAFDVGRVRPFPDQDFPLQVGSQATGNDFQDVRLAIVEVAA